MLLLFIRFKRLNYSVIIVAFLKYDTLVVHRFTINKRNVQSMNESLIVFAALLLTLNDVLFTVQDITQFQKFIVIVISHVIVHIFCDVVIPSANHI